MRKLLLILFLSTSLSLLSQAQSPLGFEGNQFSLSTGYSLYGLPLYISYELGIEEDFTLGLETTFRTYNNEKDGSNYYHNITGVSFFSNYYLNNALNIDQKWSIYSGLSIGFFKWFSTKEYVEQSKSTSTLAIGAQIGGRYYINDWGFFLEAHGGTENVGFKIGGSYRFNY